MATQLKRIEFKQRYPAFHQGLFIVVHSLLGYLILKGMNTHSTNMYGMQFKANMKTAMRNNGR